MRQVDWAASPLGPPSAWPSSLRPALSICLGSRFPIAIYWGSALALLYNDAWAPILGNKHPWAIGRPARAVWPEIWDTIGPLFDHVLLTGEATYREDQLLPMRRHGYTEECYFNYTFSPIRSEGAGVEGVFNAVIETTFRVITERRTRTLRDLAERLSTVRSARDACTATADVLGAAPLDVAFAALYLVDDAGTQAHLAASAGLRAEAAAAPASIAIARDHSAAWPFAAAAESHRVVTVEDLATRFATPLPGGAWPEPARAALVAPVLTGATAHPAAFLVIGASPRRAVDDAYRQFAEQVASHIGVAVSNAEAFEAERRRSEALADIDRAKTAFFSNVSHELRTPLTLMLGPTEEALRSPDRGLRGDDLDVVHRNGLRLLRLVNTLLDFSRIEAGRSDARFVRTDLAGLTADLASLFRSAVERTGLELLVRVPDAPLEAWIDREMWEKVMVNLLSNALKHTFAGHIAVDVRSDGDGIEILVADTGVGIPAEHLPRIFERFHRVPQARARSHEGTGIGLALVHEVVRLHQGTISVASAPGAGSTFRLRLRTGTAHLPADRIVDTDAEMPRPRSTHGMLEEALRWIPETPAAVERDEKHAGGAPVGAARVLVVDDNRDMREYVARLLAPHFRVDTAADGREALERFRADPPTVVVTDVMMPSVDGFELLQAIRREPDGPRTPVILLSARAGEDARLRGLETGADDYLVKPFSARELIATVRAHAQRRAFEDRERALALKADRATAELDRILASSGEGFAALDRDMRYVYVNDAATRLVGMRRDDVLGKTPDQLFPPELAATLVGKVHDAVESRRAQQYEVVHDGRWFENRLYASEDGVFVFFSDVTATKQAEAAHARAAAALQDSRDVLGLAMRSARMGAWSRNLVTNEVWWSRELEEIFGLPPGGFTGTEAGFLAFVHADDRPAVERAVAEAIANHHDYSVEFRFRTASGALRWMEGRGRASYDVDGTPQALHGLGIDITERKTSETALAEALARERLLVRLDDAVRPLVDPEQITFTAARLLGEHLHVSRCAYATVEADEDAFFLTGNYTQGVASIVGHYTFRQFGAECLRLMRAGLPFVVTDSRLDPRLEARDRESYEQTEIRGVICVPILKSDRFVAAMAVHTNTPRTWRSAEVELVQQVASRCWESIERARVEGERTGLLDAAEAANRAKDEFMAMLGHELRNPLSPIVTALQLMKLRGGVASERERTVIERQVTHLTRLVDDLLDVSRIARGKVELKLETIEMAQVVASAIEVASPLLEQRQHAITIDVPRTGLAVEGDVARLSQILSNLLTNAAKYTPPGGRITVSAAADGADVVLRVRDTGVGINADVLPRVFDLFVQGRQSIDRAEGGLGLGLTIVRSLVERHGGTVSAASEGVDKGSEFIVRLPHAAQPAAAAAPAADGDLASDADSERRGARVLIVDDNDDAATMLAYALRAKGYDAHLAHDGFEALRIAADIRPHLALLDIGLPVMDGYELAGQLRALEGLTSLPLIAVTGYGQDADRQRSSVAGFQHHVVKPVDLDRLFDLMSAALAEG